MLDQKLFTPTTATEKITVFYIKINRHMFINVIFSAILKNPHQDNQEYRILFSPPFLECFVWQAYLSTFTISSKVLRLIPTRNLRQLSESA